jgi:beta-galactosidase
MSRPKAARAPGRPPGRPAWSGGFLYGGDYNPEQWDSAMGYDAETVYREDIRLMQLAGVNVACPAIFAWTALQPAEERYTFEWLDRVMDLLAEGGIGACLGTATAAQPAWLSRAYPDVLPVDEWGRRRRHGTRMNFCPTSPDFHRLGRALVRKLAERYRDHRALRMWHVSNEYGPSCYCDRCASRFRTWLEARYGSLDGVNRAWVTAFWSHTYTSWEQVEPPMRIGEVSIQGLSLDYRRFISDMNLECYEGEAGILREQTPGVPVFTNFHGTRDIDYFTWAQRQDLIAYDSYPQPEDHPEKTAFRFDLMRGLRGGAAWLLLEQTPSQTQWQPYNPLRRPEEVRFHSYQAIARGSSGAMFFQWRQSRGSDEMHHGAIVGNSGRADTRVFREVTALGRELQALGSVLAGATTPARVGLVYSWPNQWALDFPRRLSRDLDYEAEVLHYYAALWRRNIAVDVISPDTPLGQNDLVVAPLLYMVTEAQAAAFERYVQGGGVLLTTYFSGVIGEDGRAWLGDRPGPAALQRTLGIRVEEVDPFVPGHVNHIVSSDPRLAGETDDVCRLWAEVVHLDGARVKATFRDDFYAGSPAVTEHAHGKGRGLYVATHPDAGFMDRMLGWICDDLGIVAPMAAPAEVEVNQRRTVAGTVTFLLNHGAGRQEVPLAAPMRDLLSGATVRDVIALQPRGVAALVATEDGPPGSG